MRNFDELMSELDLGEISVKEAAEEITAIYRNRCDIGDAVHMAAILNKEYILETVTYQVINKGMNANLLKRVPHKEFLDLAAIYRVVGKTDESRGASAIVTDILCNSYSLSEDELDAAARRNTEENGFNVQSVGSFLSENGILFAGFEPVPMWIISNHEKINGAAVMLYKDCFEDLSNKLGSDLYILPSSIHEVIAVPAAGAEVDFLKTMVREINATKVAAEEVLSDTVYRYSRDDGLLIA